MKKRFKKIYIEITNNCNLNCSFCAPDYRKKEFMSIEKFEIIISKIKDYTDYIYLHVKGEPLMHPNINEIIDIASKKGLYINITTNGTLIDNLKSKNVRQINYSIQSMEKVEKIKQTITKMKEYVKKNNTYLSLRLWTNKTKENIKIKEMLKEEFRFSGELEDKYKLDNNIFLSIEKEFIWPDMKNEIVRTKGFCYGLKDQIGILVDGTVVPCCLDHKGTINLGNILKQEMKEILEQKRVKDMIEGFEEKRLVEELCQKCGFKN